MLRSRHENALKKFSCLKTEIMMGYRIFVW